ncbi:MAG: hypothetical protein JKY22_12380 [Flavobacteriaceae bacterium]|nr:hypothetical protein [Flavobacteriaceae bacterium]
MATLSVTMPTLLDWAKTRDPDGKTAKIVEMLSQTNTALEDMVVKEGNLATGERVTIRTGLPTAYYRMINAGTPPSKATTVQVVENAAMLESRSHVDVKQAKLEGDVNAYRLQMATAHMESMSQAQATTLFYGSASNPEEYVGLANRYNDLSAANGDNIIDAGGTGSDNMSIWLLGWSTNTIYGIFPKGSTAGLSHEDLGIDDVDDADGNPFRAYKDLFQWDNGLVVADWRYGVRIANVDNSDLVAATGTQASTASTAIIKLMARAIDHLPAITNVKPAFYVNRTVASHLRVAALDKSSSAVTIEKAINQFGRNIHQLMFLGVPVRLQDVLTIAEAQVV